MHVIIYSWIFLFHSSKQKRQVVDYFWNEQIHHGDQFENFPTEQRNHYCPRKMIPKWDAKRKWWGLRSCFSLSHERRHRKIYNKTSLGTCRRRIHINSVCEMKESRNFKAAYRWLEKSFVWNLVQNKCSIGEMKVGESWKITFVNLALGEYLFEKNFKMITLVGLVCHNFLVN